MRITGLATGLDVDTMVKQMLTPYQNRVDKVKQDKDIIDLKQQLYRDVITDMNNLYKKFFDTTSSTSLILSNNYKTSIFTSSSSAVSAEGLAGALVGNYKVNVTETAKPAQITETAENLGDKKLDMFVNGKRVELDLTGITDAKEIVNKINDSLSKAGIEGKASFSTITGKVVIQSNNQGTSQTLEIKEFNNKTSASVSGIDINSIKGNMFEVNINGTLKKIDLTNTDGLTDDEILEKINKSLGTTATAEIDGAGKLTIKSSAQGDGNKISASIKAPLAVANGTASEKANIKISLDELKGKNTSIYVNGRQIKLDLTDVPDGEVEDKIKSTLSNYADITFDGSNNVEITSKAVGENQKISIINEGSEVAVGTTTDGTTDYTGGMIISAQGSDIVGTVTDSFGNTTDIASISKGSNTFVVDNVKITVSDVTKGDVILTGKADNTQFMTNIKGFVEEYNKLIEKVSTLVNEKKQYTYKPLTDAQKEDMSEEEIKLWNEKTKQGLLKSDDILEGLLTDLRKAITTPFAGSNMSLGSIGITFDSDYRGKPNQLTIDETKLSKALENNSEEIMKLFTGLPDSTVSSSSDKYSNTGIMNRIKNTLYSTGVASTSELITKAGYNGKRQYDNDLYKALQKKEEEIKNLQKLLKTKEDAYYVKFAALEKAMNNYNSQSSWLSQQFSS